MQENYQAKEESNSEGNTVEPIEFFPPNNTVYIRNLNEKIPVEGSFFF